MKKAVKKVAVKKLSSKKVAVKKLAIKKAAPKRAPLPPVQACMFPTAIGNMAISWKNEDVVGVFLPESSQKKLLDSVRRRAKATKLNWTSAPPAHVGHIAAQIRAHLRGEPQEFSLERFSLGEGFARKVYEQSLHIPSGKVITYRELAEEMGSPKSFKAVGLAMSKNPFPIVVPGHRVTGSSKVAGVEAKILKIETPSTQS